MLDEALLRPGRLEAPYQIWISLHILHCLSQAIHRYQTLFDTRLSFFMLNEKMKYIAKTDRQGIIGSFGGTVVAISIRNPVDLRTEEEEAMFAESRRRTPVVVLIISRIL